MKAGFPNHKDEIDVLYKLASDGRKAGTVIPTSPGHPAIGFTDPRHPPAFPSGDAALATDAVLHIYKQSYACI
jgi:hypothetical protein